MAYVVKVNVSLELGTENPRVGWGPSHLTFCQ